MYSYNCIKLNTSVSKTELCIAIYFFQDIVYSSIIEVPNNYTNEDIDSFVNSIIDSLEGLQ